MELLKANKEPQKPNSIYYGYGSSYKIIDVLNDKDGDFINCRLFIVKELGVDECLGFSANIRRFLDRGPYNIEWLMRKYLGVGFRSCKVERI
ncbi:hypothetical protein HpBGD72_10930 [Helicobacter pylori]